MLLKKKFKIGAYSQTRKLIKKQQPADYFL